MSERTAAATATKDTKAPKETTDVTAATTGQTGTGASPTAPNFDPSKYLVRINGRGEYLEVKWRLLWLRNEHPGAVIETELVRLEREEAVFKARVSIPGGGSATGWGSESVGDFRDFVEKAETKAIGRALAALGFGTQFCQDHEFGAASNWVVDAPVELNAREREPRRMLRERGAEPAARANGSGGGNITTAAQLQQATERQVKFIHAIAREAGLDEAELESWSEELYGVGVNALNRRDASALIEQLQRRRNEVA